MGSRLCFRLALCLALVAAPIRTMQLQAAESGAEFVAKNAATDTVAGVAVDWAQIMKTPLFKYVPVEVATALGGKYASIDPAQFTHLSVVLGVIGPGGPTGALVVVESGQTFSAEKIVETVNQHVAEHEKLKVVTIGEKQAIIGPREQKQQNGDPIIALFCEGSRLVLGVNESVSSYARGKLPEQPSKVALTLKKLSAENQIAISLDIDQLRPLLMFGLSQIREVGEKELAALNQLVRDVSQVNLQVNFADNSKNELRFITADADKADALAKTFDTLSVGWHGKAMEVVDQLLAECQDPDIKSAWQQYLKRSDVVNENNFKLPFVVEGSDLVIDFTTLPLETVTPAAVMGVLVALMLPALSAARNAARGTNDSNNFKQVALAFHNYESTHGSFPAPAICDKDGKPLLSWRVAILPYLDQSALYEQFHLDEPWNSEHNLPLAKKVIEVYQSSKKGVPPLRDGCATSNIVVPTGKGTLFPAVSKKVKMKEVTDGLSGTILLLEVTNEAAPIWTQPVDWELDTNAIARGLMNPGEKDPTMIIATGDGAVQKLDLMKLSIEAFIGALSPTAAVAPAEQAAPAPPTDAVPAPAP